MSLLKLRADKKAKKPTFVRQNAGHKKEVGTKYRKPRGYQSKLRLGKSPRGLVLPSQGYRAPKALRGTNPDGLQEVLVHAVKDLDAIDSKTQCVVIGSTVGRKQKITLLEKVVEKKLPCSIDAQSTIDTLKKQFEDQKTSRKGVVAKRKAQEEAEKAADKKPKEKSKEKDSEASKEVKTEDKEKKEKDKILTKKETAM